MNVLEICDAVQKYHLDPLDKSKNSNMLSKTDNVTHINGINLLSQENQGYDNQHDQQLMIRKNNGGQGHHNLSNPQPIAHKHNGGVEWVNTELEPDSVQEEKKEWFCQWADNYDVWNNNSYTPTKEKKMKWGAPTNLTLTPEFSTLPKANITGNQKQEL